MKKKSKAKTGMITMEQAFQICDRYAAAVAALPAQYAPKMAKAAIRRFKRELGVDLTKRHPEAGRLLTEFFYRHLVNTFILATEKFSARYASTPVPANAPVETVTCHNP